MSQMVKVFRVEGPNGYGMYQGLWYNIGLPTSANHPCVWEDSLYCESAAKYDENLVRRSPEGTLNWATEPLGSRFAFKSLEQLRRWIYDDSWIVQLSEAGATLCVYEVDSAHLIVGRTQVTFLAEHSNLFSKEPLGNILSIPSEFLRDS